MVSSTKFSVFALLIFAALMSGKDKHMLVAPIEGGPSPTMTASEIERTPVRYPSTIHLKGSVEVNIPVCIPAGENGKRTCDGQMIVRADEATYHEDTGEIEATGSVHITPLCHESQPCHTSRK
jgi:lipopolysaccharide assembly outer membrane protein LptD (OstA)